MKPFNPGAMWYCPLSRAHYKRLFLQICTDLHVPCFLWQLTPHIDSTFFTWPTMSYKTVKGKMPLFTAQPSPKSCVTLSRWSSESFLFKLSNVRRKCWSLHINNQYKKKWSFDVLLSVSSSVKTVTRRWSNLWRGFWPSGRTGVFIQGRSSQSSGAV